MERPLANPLLADWVVLPRIQRYISNQENNRQDFWRWWTEVKHISSPEITYAYRIGPRCPTKPIQLVCDFRSYFDANVPNRFHFVIKVFFLRNLTQFPDREEELISVRTWSLTWSTGTEMRTLNSINVDFKSMTTNFAGVLLFLFHCTSWYNGDNTFTLVQNAVELYISLLRFIEKWWNYLSTA